MAEGDSMIESYPPAGVWVHVTAAYACQGDFDNDILHIQF